MTKRLFAALVFRRHTNSCYNYSIAGPYTISKFAIWLTLKCEGTGG